MSVKVTTSTSLDRDGIESQDRGYRDGTNLLPAAITRGMGYAEVYSLKGMTNLARHWIAHEQAGIHLLLIGGHLTIAVVEKIRSSPHDPQLAVYIGKQIIFADDVLYGRSFLDINFFMSETLGIRRVSA